MLYYMEGNKEKALEMTNKALALAPNYPRFIKNRAECYILLKQYDEALYDCQHLLQTDPSYKDIVAEMRARIAKERQEKG